MRHDLMSFDVMIAGGNYVGLALALALAQAVPGVRLAVIEPRRPDELGADGRAFAIAAAGRRLFEALGAWDEVAAVASPVVEMVITDSRLADVVRPVFLTFEAERDGPLAHMVGNGALVAALRRAAAAAGVALLADAVADFTSGAGAVEVTLAAGGRLASRLLVAADGGRSRLRGLAGIGVNRWDYGQSAVVATIRHERPHDGRAEEHFLPSGPLATLPLADDADGRHRSSLVWAEAPAVAERLARCDDFLFESELTRRLGQRFGTLEAVGRRAAHPLGLTLARRLVAPRLALVGDAAHAMHPIAGQGLNLGLNDVAALAEVLADGLRLGRDPGAADLLADYERWRLADILRVSATADALTRLFSNDRLALRLLRDVGLGVVDRLPPLKRWLMTAAAGPAGRAPKLTLGTRL